MNSHRFITSSQCYLAAALAVLLAMRVVAGLDYIRPLPPHDALKKHEVPLAKKSALIRREKPQVSKAEVSKKELLATTSPTKGCNTPTGARWCRVKLPGIPPYNMAVYSDVGESTDIVSSTICKTGAFEKVRFQDLGAPGEALDIGGNIGYYTFALAKAGWNVTTFEPMHDNIKLLKATLCENPELESKVKLLNIGLGAKDEVCRIISPSQNVGDGITRCGGSDLDDDGLLTWGKSLGFSNYVVRGEFTMRRLEDVLAEQKISKVDFVKIDVEGFECQVFKGAPNFLARYKPRKIHTEVWKNLQGCDPRGYLDSFASTGYKVASDQSCGFQDRTPPRKKVSVKNYWLCKDTSLLQTQEHHRIHRRHVKLHLA